jgi:hypothetical protein
MEKDDQPTATDLYMEHLKQAWADTQSSSDQLDKSILTYSSAGLGVSIVFLKDIVPIADAVGLRLLYASWIAFGIAILATIVSFQVSIHAQELHLDHLRKYYLERKGEYLNPRNTFATWLGYLRCVSSVSFILAIIGTICFAVWNISEVKQMSFQLKINGGRMPMGITPLNQTPAILQKGRKPMSMTPLPNQVSPAADLAPASSAQPTVAPAVTAPAIVPSQTDKK